MSTTENMKSKMLMPEFTIDTITTENGQEIPGIKRMFDIALALKDSVMQWGAPGVGKSQGVMQWNQEKVEEYKKIINELLMVKKLNLGILMYVMCVCQ